MLFSHSSILVTNWVCCSLSVLQSNLNLFTAGWKMIIQNYVCIDVVLRGALQCPAEPGKSYLTGWMYFKCFGVSLFWPLPPFLSWGCVFFSQTLSSDGGQWWSCKWEEIVSIFKCILASNFTEIKLKKKNYICIYVCCVRCSCSCICIYGLNLGKKKLFG